MKASTLTLQAHAKWILAGEHAVLRKHPALVFPLTDKTITLNYTHNNNPLHIEFDSPYGETLLLMFWGLLEAALEKLEQSRTDLTGEFHIVNTIPMGAGMGFSSALCVIITRWLIAQNWLSESELFNFARQLENHFHTTSSGVDIIGAMHNQGGIFNHGGHFEPLNPAWQPFLYLSYSEALSVTAQCVQSVAKLWETEPTQAANLDQAMHNSVLQAIEALRYNTDSALTNLSDAIQKACDCFQAWHLIPHETNQHIQALKKWGALAAKPTGAGNGGYIVSLWPEAPSTHPSIELVRIKGI